MNPADMRCAGCGALLSSPTAVCAACDAADAKAQPRGAHACPTCSGRFDHPLIVYLPQDAPLWRWRSASLTCPHCAQTLLDRAREPVSPWPIAALLGVAAVGVRVLPAGRWQNLFVLGLSAAYALVYSWRTREARHAPDRYRSRPPEFDIPWTGAWIARRLRMAWQRSTRPRKD